MFIGQVVSVNVGLPRNVVWNDHSVSTGIFKEPVAGRVRVHTVGLEGDLSIRPYSNLQAAIEDALKLKGKESKILIVRDGGVTVPMPKSSP